MEEKGALTSAIESRLYGLCTAMNVSLGKLIDRIAPTITMQDIDQLPLLVLGVQIDGALRNRIGADATLGVFEAVTSIVMGSVDLMRHEPNRISFLNNSNRLVTIKLAADPDMVIEEKIGGSSAFKVAIEIKGGTDASNAHNRAGEAEKSHRKVSTQARDFWTVISLHKIDEAALRTESPSHRRHENGSTSRRSSLEPVRAGSSSPARSPSPAESDPIASLDSYARGLVSPSAPVRYKPLASRSTPGRDEVWRHRMSTGRPLRRAHPEMRRDRRSDGSLPAAQQASVCTERRHAVRRAGAQSRRCLRHDEWTRLKGAGAHRLTLAPPRVGVCSAP